MNYRDLPSFPTRRSSDLVGRVVTEVHAEAIGDRVQERAAAEDVGVVADQEQTAAVAHPGFDGIDLGRRVRCGRSEEHTSELQSLRHLVCRLLLEKKKDTK